jgi:hypothetical protein
MRYPFHNEISLKCPKCGGGVIFNIKEKPEFRTTKGWSGYCEYCDERFSYDECKDREPTDSSGDSSSGK